MSSQEQSYISYFTPSQMSHETLEAILVKRQSLAIRLVEKIKQSVLTEAKHQTLLLGPRGIGKSYLVALVYHRVRTLPKLQGKIAIAYFAEEEWSVASLTDLLLVILKALEREYGGLQPRIDSLYRLPVREIEGAADALIREFVAKRTLLILVENLDEIFRGLGDEGQWAFRSFLSERPFVTILATTPSLFAGVAKQHAAFFGFFQPIYLDELNVEEATELLEKLAAQRDDTKLAAFLKTPTAQERVQAVHDLAGGHPRIYLLFAHLLTQESLDELVTPFLQLLDELTPYYQSRMQLLSPQQRKIVAFLCSARGAVAVRDIAAQNLLTSQTASGQLDKLEEMAYVRKTTVGRESLYELREPLLRMVIEVKRGRNEPVRLIVDFLRRWYNRSERQERLARVSSQHPMTREYLIASLDLERAVQDKPDMERARRFSAEYAKYLEANQFDRACEIAAEIIERKGTACTPNDWFQYGFCLSKTNQHKTALPIWDNVVNSDANNAAAWNNRGIALWKLANYKAALASYDKALALDPNHALARYNRGNALRNLGDYDAALESPEQVRQESTGVNATTAPKINDIWRRYKLNNDPQARGELIQHFAYLVKTTVGRVSRNLLPNLERDDLVSAGIFGLIKAVDQFDLNCNITFDAYAIALIRGAILEMLHTDDWVPRTIRENATMLERTYARLEFKLGRPAMETEMAAELGIELEEYQKLLVETGCAASLSLEDLLVGNDSCDDLYGTNVIHDEAMAPSLEAELHERKHMLGRSIGRLPERERLVIALYYHEGMTFKEISTVLRISESRVYQLHTQAVLRLRAQLDEALSRDPNFAAGRFNLAEAELASGRWERFLAHIKRGFALPPTLDKWYGDTKEFCRLLLRHNDFEEKIASISRIYADHGALGSLGKGVTQSISAVLESRVSQSVAEEWLRAWQTASQQMAEMEIPLRLLAAAVEWKETRSIRALLALPIEERRILESLLPKLEQQTLPQ
jgi:FliA/WhiG family RNA polymerase sigma factor